MDEYVSRMGDDQETIWYLAGMDQKTATASPHLESFRDKGIEVLLMSEPVDEWMLQRFNEFGDKSLKAIDQGEVDLIVEQRHDPVGMIAFQDEFLLNFPGHAGHIGGHAEVILPFIDRVDVAADSDGALRVKASFATSLAASVVENP